MFTGHRNFNQRLDTRVHSLKVRIGALFQRPLRYISSPDSGDTYCVQK